MKILVDFVVLAMLYIFIFYAKWIRKGKDILFVNTLMYIYISFVLYFTMMPVITNIPSIFSHSYSFMNLVPFVDVVSARGDFVRQIVLNVIMMIPFGFLFPLIRAENSTFFKTVLSCFFFSLAIEILQPLIDESRSSDVTDLLTNTLGGAVGYVGYMLFRPITNKMLNYIKKS